MTYINLRREYHSRTAWNGWRFALKYQFKNGPCPYHLAHRNIKNRLLGDLLFEKWNKRPSSAYKLYWRMHPAELEVYNNRKKK